MANDLPNNDPLEGIRILQSLSAKERMGLARECAWLTIAAEQVVFDKEDESRDVMFLVGGKVVVTVYSITGREVSFDELSAGDFFGELAAIDEEPRSAAIVSKTQSELAILSAARFLQLLTRNADIAMNVMHRMSEVIRKSNERIMDFAALDTQQRVCSEILKLAKPSPGVPETWSVNPLPTQKVMASRADTSRETVARVFRGLTRGGVAKRKGRTLIIPDRQKLETLTSRLKNRGDAGRT